MSMLAFRDVTLGYDRHPAVHHLSGDVQPGALVEEEVLLKGCIVLKRNARGEPHIIG